MRLRPLAWGVAAGSETALSLWRGVVTPPSCLLALPCLLVRRYRLVTGGSRESRDAERRFAVVHIHGHVAPARSGHSDPRDRDGTSRDEVAAHRTRPMWSRRGPNVARRSEIAADRRDWCE